MGRRLNGAYSYLRSSAFLENISDPSRVSGGDTLAFRYVATVGDSCFVSMCLLPALCADCVTQIRLHKVRLRCAIVGAERLLFFRDVSLPSLEPKEFLASSRGGVL